MTNLSYPTHSVGNQRNVGQRERERRGLSPPFDNYSSAVRWVEKQKEYACYICMIKYNERVNEWCFALIEKKPWRNTHTFFCRADLRQLIFWVYRSNKLSAYSTNKRWKENKHLYAFSVPWEKKVIILLMWKKRTKFAVTRYRVSFPTINFSFERVVSALPNPWTDKRDGQKRTHNLCLF